MKGFLFTLILATMVPTVVRAADPTNVEASVKPLLIHGIEKYIEQKYTVAIKYFEEVLKLDPKNELATMYIESSRQRLSELELQEN